MVKAAPGCTRLSSIDLVSLDICLILERITMTEIPHRIKRGLFAGIGRAPQMWFGEENVLTVIATISRSGVNGGYLRLRQPY